MIDSIRIPHVDVEGFPSDIIVEFWHGKMDEDMHTR